ncbi:MAG: hypothetical protein AAF849_02185 [Bacteroidota bacterium]
MKFRYSTLHPEQNQLDSLPRVPLQISLADKSIEVVGLLDSGATINVLPFDIGKSLGATWEEQKAIIPLAGNLRQSLAQPLILNAIVGEYPSVQLAFAWVNHNNVPLILGQTNFFAEFDVAFYRSRFEFEVKPKNPKANLSEK